MTREETDDKLAKDFELSWAIRSVERIPPLGPNDVIVAEVDSCITEDVAQRIKEKLESVFAGRKVLVHDSGLKLKIFAEK